MELRLALEVYPVRVKQGLRWVKEKKKEKLREERIITRGKVRTGCIRGTGASLYGQE